MIFEFPVNEFGPRGLGDVWLNLRAVMWDKVAILSISETPGGVVRLEIASDRENEARLEEVKILIQRMGGRLLEIGEKTFKFWIPPHMRSCFIHNFGETVATFSGYLPNGKSNIGFSMTGDYATGLDVCFSFCDHTSGICEKNLLERMKIFEAVQR